MVEVINLGIDFYGSFCIKSPDKLFFMSITFNQLPGDENKNMQPGNQEGNDSSSENTSISLPRIDRPEGPFEHSGETAGWTKEEKEEKDQEAEQQ